MIVVKNTTINYFLPVFFTLTEGRNENIEIIV